MKKEEIIQKLAEFVEKLKKVSEVIGIAYKGSTATQKWDKYSDLDIDIFVKDRNYKKFLKKIPQLLAWWGELKFSNHYKGYDETYGFIGSEYFKIEIDPINEKRLDTPNFDFKDIKIVYDKTGKINKIKKRSQKLKELHLNKNLFTWSLLDTKSNFLYVANKCGRGQIWEAVDELNSNIRGDIFMLLAKTKGMEDYELGRTAEKNLSRKEWELWKKSLCVNFDKKSIKKAIEYAWKFMTYVEKEYEKISGQKLNLKTNNKEILNRVLELVK